MTESYPTVSRTSALKRPSSKYDAPCPVLAWRSKASGALNAFGAVQICPLLPTTCLPWQEMQETLAVDSFGKTPQQLGLVSAGTLLVHASNPPAMILDRFRTLPVPQFFCPYNL